MTNFETLVNPARPYETDVAAELAVRGNRRRLRVFLRTFLTVLAVGLIFTYSRPAEYRAQARIAIKKAGAVTALAAAQPGSATVTTAANGAAAGSLLGEAGRILSRPQIDAALVTLHQRGVDVSGFGSDPALGIQAALSAEPIPETNLVDLTMTGPQPEHLAAILNALIEAYSWQTLASYASSATSENATLRQELDNLDRRLAEKTKALDDFRRAADIVSGERDENQILARVKGLSESLNQAGDKVAQADGRVRSLRESLTAGKSVVRARDNPTLAALETRASQLREALREQERIYTPQFMAMDPNVRGMRSRLADLEGQIVEQKGNAGQVALREAEDDLAASRLAQLKLQRQIAEERSAVHSFARNFTTFKSMQDELAQLEASRRSLSERLLRSETSETSRMPAVQVVESAVAAPDIWRPDYSRDAAISFAVALVAGLLAMALIEQFNRSPPATIQAPSQPQPWITLLARQPLPDKLPPPIEAGQALLPGIADLPRELAQAEVTGLLQAVPDEDFPWVTLLLCGATPAEIRRITAADLHREAAAIRIPGPAARSIILPEMLFGQLAALALRPDHQRSEVVELPHSEDELKRRLICAAHDAGLDDPATVTPETLRHTCIAHLLRQGLRFSDLEHIVGALPTEALREYASLSPVGVRRTLAQIQPLMPALQTLART
ncbi:GumC family protein [Dechloromonas denitrificans]|uniref:GumC family protein n=1 Tax=Dechloromonas denitrificans TaxID=281362 RepID=UPI001CF94E27|nr:hypothetical protein [Dechloromonas denitrificans]UCV08581.1 hypothetical protein KI615_03345 [Dechloromonas denitrificans]